MFNLTDVAQTIYIYSVILCKVMADYNNAIGIQIFYGEFKLGNAMYYTVYNVVIM